MTAEEKETLINELKYTFPDIPEEEILQAISLYENLQFDKAKLKIKILIIERLIMTLEEKIRLGELEIENKGKLEALKELLKDLQNAEKKANSKVGVFYIEKD